MTMHQFCIDDAQKYGVEGAIVLANMRFWIAKNKANERHFYQGRYWTYNSSRAFSELFPYWSPHQIRRILAKLVSDGVMVVGEFNQNPYDHTKWYSLNCDIDFAKSSNRIDETVTSLDTDNKPFSKPNINKAAIRGVVQCPDSVDQQIWNDWIALRKAKRAPVTETVLQTARAEAAKAGMTLEAFLQVWCHRGSQGLQADWLKPNEKQQAKSFAQQEREIGWARWEEMTGRQHPDRLAQQGSMGQVIDVSGNFLEIQQ